MPDSDRPADGEAATDRSELRTIVDASGLPRHEALRLLAAVRGSGGGPVLSGRETMSHAERAEFDRLVERRRKGEPLQYIEGTAAFGPIEVIVDPRVLIPRPETEQLWERVVAAMDGSETVVDVGTGSGAVALGIKHAHPGARVIATDVSDGALAVARVNAKRLGLDIELRLGDIYQALGADAVGLIDVIVSNPPYIAEHEWRRLPDDVRREPRRALVGGRDGLDVVRHLIRGAPDVLRKGGRIYLEIGEEQGDAVLAMLPASVCGTIEKDLLGRDRFFVGGLGSADSAGIEEAVSALRRGEVVGLPTDTVYGLAASTEHAEAVERLFALKQRSSSKAVPVLVASLDQAESLGSFSGAARAAARAHWPGGLTLVVPVRSSLPPGAFDAGTNTVALRMPDHERALAVIGRTGPLAVTSANRSGDPPMRDARSVSSAFAHDLDVFVAGTPGRGRASTVVDFSQGGGRLLRGGPIPFSAIGQDLEDGLDHR